MKKKQFVLLFLLFIGGLLFVAYGYTGRESKPINSHDRIPASVADPRIDLDWCRKIAAAVQPPSYTLIKPYLDFFQKYLYQTEPVSGQQALAETELPMGGDTWFWADDNAKALECFVLPGALQAYKEMVTNMVRFLHAQTPGPFVFRRLAVDHPTVTKDEPVDFAINTGLMNYHGNLSRGIIFQGYRFHDGREANSLLFTGNMIRMRLGGRFKVFDFENNIVDASIIREDNGFQLLQIARLQDQGRDLATARLELVVEQGKNYTRRKMTIIPEPGISLRQVSVALGYDNLSNNDKGVKYHQAFVMHRPGVANRTGRREQHPQYLAKGAIKWFSLFQDENLGFSYAFFSIPDKPSQVRSVMAEGGGSGLFHYVYTWYDLGDIDESNSAAASERNVLVAGGLYQSMALYDPIMDELDRHANKDLSISYDYGAELNAIAALCLREAADNVAFNSGEYFNDKTLAWFDEKFKAFRDNLLACKDGRQVYLFSRGLAFAVLACDAMFRATGESRYLDWQLEGVRIIKEISRPGRSHGRFFPHNQNIATFLDTQGASILALARTSLLTRDTELAKMAVEGLMAIEIRSDNEKEKRIWLSYHPEDKRGENQMWIFKGALVARAVRNVQLLIEFGLIEVNKAEQAHLDGLLQETQDYIHLSTRSRDGAKEILTSYRSAETNSECQPWGMLALVGVDECYLAKVPPPAQ